MNHQEALFYAKCPTLGGHTPSINIVGINSISATRNIERILTGKPSQKA
jgi:hypothetical protein